MLYTLQTTSEKPVYTCKIIWIKPRISKFSFTKYDALAHHIVFGKPIINTWSIALLLFIDLDLTTTWTEHRLRFHTSSRRVQLSTDMMIMSSRLVLCIFIFTCTSHKRFFNNVNRYAPITRAPAKAACPYENTQVSLPLFKVRSGFWRSRNIFCIPSPTNWRGGNAAGLVLSWFNDFKC